RSSGDHLWRRQGRLRSLESRGEQVVGTALVCQRTGASRCTRLLARAGCYRARTPPGGHGGTGSRDLQQPHAEHVDRRRRSRPARRKSGSPPLAPWSLPRSGLPARGFGSRLASQMYVNARSRRLGRLVGLSALAAAAIAFLILLAVVSNEATPAASFG